MIKGKARKETSPVKIEDVLSRIDEWSIFRFYLGVDFRVGKPFCNPFRDDRNPSVTINNLNSGLQLMDWADCSWRGDCFDILKKRYSFSLQQVLQMINEDFGLGLGSVEKYHIRKAPVYKVPKVEEKKTSLIQFTGRRPSKFNSLESAYWNSYHTSFSILNREHVFGVKELFIDREKFILPKDEPVFAYYEPSIKKVKIYRPFANKQKKEWKWRSTIPFTHLFGLSDLQPADRIVIAKAQKCRIVLLHHLESVVAVQGESFAALNDESLTKIKSLSREQYVNFGSDPQGKEMSWKITEQLGLKHLNTPDKYLQEDINDMAELCKYYGHSAIESFLIKKGIIQQLKQTG